MTNTIQVDAGDSLELAFAWKNDDGTPMDLAGATFSIYQPSHTPLASMALTASADPGVIDGAMTDAAVALLPRGRLANFRLRVELANDQVQSTPPIWVEVL